MAVLNDYKMVASRAIKHLTLAQSIIDPDNTIVVNLSDEQKARYGFYYLAIQAITDIADYDDITEGIVDTEFNSTFYGIHERDEGIDAIFIDNNSNHISLFNFKYRAKFNIDQQQNLNETILSAKYLSVLNTQHNDLTGKLRQATDTILSCLNSNEEWQITFYVVSNENHPIPADDRNLQQMKAIYGINIETIGLDDICNLISDRPTDINAKVILPKDALMSYSENSLDSRKSYIMRLNLVELIRITSSDANLRYNASIEDTAPIAECDIDMSVLYDNIRGYLSRSGFNKNIASTLKLNPSKFFFYNNGITIVADNIQVTEINAQTKYKIELSGFQVLNGGQTLRTIHEFNKKDENNLIQYLSKAEVLVRILNVTDIAEKNRIGEFTNSQNSINLSDLRSTRPEQLALEQFLDDHNIHYVRKRGNVGREDNKHYKSTISMSRMGQILLAKKGKPEQTSNKKSAIFDSYYSDLFEDANLLSQETLETIELFNRISCIYRQSQYETTEQKKFYILYIIVRFQIKAEIIAIIEIFEEYINQFIKEKQLQLSPSRVLIRNDFKIWLDEQLTKIDM